MALVLDNGPNHLIHISHTFECESISSTEDIQAQNVWCQIILFDAVKQNQMSWPNLKLSFLTVSGFVLNEKLKRNTQSGSKWKNPIHMIGFSKLLQKFGKDWSISLELFVEYKMVRCAVSGETQKYKLLLEEGRISLWLLLSSFCYIC